MISFEYLRLRRLDNPAGGCSLRKPRAAPYYIAEGSGDRREPVPVALRQAQRKLYQVRYAVEFVLNILEAGNLLFSFLEIQDSRIVGVEFLNQCAFGVTFLEVLIVIQITIICRYCIEITHI